MFADYVNDNDNDGENKDNDQNDFDGSDQNIVNGVGGMFPQPGCVQNKQLLAVLCVFLCHTNSYLYRKIFVFVSKYSPSSGRTFSQSNVIKNIISKSYNASSGSGFLLQVKTSGQES